MVKRIMQLGVFLILIGGVILYFYLRDEPATETVRVYEVPERSPQRLTATEGELANDTHTGHTHTHTEHDPRLMRCIPSPFLFMRQMRWETLLRLKPKQWT